MAGRPARSMLVLAALLFAAYLANVVAGRIGFMSGAIAAAGVGDVAEMLLLAAACVAFTTATLLLERDRARAAAQPGGGDPTTPDNESTKGGAR